MRALIIVLGLGMYLLVPAAWAQSIASGGSERIVTVKKKAVTYAAMDGAGGWSVAVTGPTTLGVGLRMAAKGKKPAVGQLVASLDGGADLHTGFSAKPDAAAKSKSDRKAKLTQEAVVAFDVPAGKHTLRLRLVVDSANAALLRLVSPVPASAVLAATLPLPQAAQPPKPAVVVANAEPTPPPAPAPAAPPPAPPVVVAEEIVAKDVGGSTTIPTAEQVSVTDPAPSAPAASPKLLGFEAGVELGVGFPQVLTKLGTGLSVGIEAGYLLPVLDQRVEIFADAWYSQALRRASATDARLAAGESFDFTLIEQEVVFHLGGLYRVFPPRTFINGYGLAAVYLDLQRSTVKGDASGAGFGKNTETETAVGFTLGGGAELTLGPGAVAAELTFAFADLSHRVTGNTSNGGLALALGYHLLF